MIHWSIILKCVIEKKLQMTCDFTCYSCKSCTGLGIPIILKCIIEKNFKCHTASNSTTSNDRLIWRVPSNDTHISFPPVQIISFFTVWMCSTMKYLQNNVSFSKRLQMIAKSIICVSQMIDYVFKSNHFVSFEWVSLWSTFKITYRFQNDFKW